jgi:hypothetical protein
MYTNSVRPVLRRRRDELVPPSRFVLAPQSGEDKGEGRRPSIAKSVPSPGGLQPSPLPAQQGEVKASDPTGHLHCGAVLVSRRRNSVNAEAPRRTPEHFDIVLTQETADEGAA